MNGILFFDTETTGIADFKLPEVHPSHPRLLQLAAILADTQGREIASFNTLIAHAADLVIPDGASAVHGITTADLAVYGVPMITAIGMFNALASKAHTVVAHNLEFDLRIVRSEIARMNHALHQAGKPKGRDLLDPANAAALKRFCTMQESAQVLNMTGYGGKPKYPKLQELHQFYFGQQFDKAHDAMADTRACKLCYFRLIAPATVFDEHAANDGMNDREREASTSEFVKQLREGDLKAEFISEDENQARKEAALKSKRKPSGSARNENVNYNI